MLWFGLLCGQKKRIFHIFIVDLEAHFIPAKWVPSKGLGGFRKAWKGSYFATGSQQAEEIFEPARLGGHVNIHIHVHMWGFVYYISWETIVVELLLIRWKCLCGKYGKVNALGWGKNWTGWIRFCDVNGNKRLRKREYKAFEVLEANWESEFVF